MRLRGKVKIMAGLALALAASAVVPAVGAQVIRPRPAPAKTERPGEFESKPARDWLQALQDPAPQVHHRAMRALSEIRPVASDTVAGLVQLVRGADLQVRRRALQVLGRLGPEAKGAFPIVLAALQDGDAEVRRLAASALGEVSAETRDDRLGLVATLRHPYHYARDQAERALGKLGAGAADVAPELGRLVEQPSDPVRHAALRALSRMGPDVALPILIPLLTHNDRAVRMWTAQTVAGFGAAAGPAVPTLMAMLNDHESRFLALDTLARIGPAAEPAIPRLIAMLDEPDPSREYRWGVVRVLGQNRAAARPALPKLRAELAGARLVEATGRYRDALATAISELAGAGDPALVAYAERLARALDSGDAWTRVEAALPALRRALLTDAQPKIRALAAQALGAVGPQARAALPDLEKALGDPEPSVRQQATRAIKSLGAGP
jgi:HEAT repeat protein